jgi:hypothetical protein
VSQDFAGVVTDIRLESRVNGIARWQMTVSGSTFVAGDTGVLEAVSRSGTRLLVPVLGVTLEEGEIWHIIEKPLAAGTEVVGRVSLIERGA